MRRHRYSPARERETYRRNLLADRLRALAESEANHDRAIELRAAALTIAPTAFDAEPSVCDVLDALRVLSPGEFVALVVEQRDAVPRLVPVLAKLPDREWERVSVPYERDSSTDDGGRIDT